MKKSMVEAITKEVDRIIQKTKHFPHQYEPITVVMSKKQIELFTNEILAKCKEGQSVLEKTHELGLAHLFIANKERTIIL